MRYIIAIVVLLILYTSNPNLEDHQSAVNNKVSKLIRNEVQTRQKSTSDLGEIGTELGVMFGTSLVEGIIKEVVKRKDYFIFSITSLEFNGHKKIIGVGLLGNVFISNEVDHDLKEGTEKVKTAWNDISDLNNTSSTDNNNLDDKDPENNQTVYNSSKEYYVNADESNKVYFYDNPDYNSLRDSYFSSREKVTAIRIENDFAYIEFINSNSQTTKGWILLSDLTAIQ